MTKPTAREIFDSWMRNEQIRLAFKSIGSYQDFCLNPKNSPIQVVENIPGKISIVESGKQDFAPSSPKQSPEHQLTIPDWFKDDDTRNRH